ncbi:MAG: hypothetical protein ACR2MO_17060 [Acidimicrobiales bacterium]
MGTAADYSVLGATTVTNTGNSVLRGSLGLWPGSSITGFPPGEGTTTTTTPGGDISTTDLGRDAPGTAAPRPVPGRTTSTPRRLTEIGLTTGGPARPRIPGVVGPPRTGAAPSGTGGSPWPAVLAAGLGGAVAAAFVRRHRMASTGAKPTGR